MAEPGVAASVGRGMRFLALTPLLLVGCSLSPGAAPEAVTAVDLARSAQTFGAAQANLSVAGKPLTLAGRVYAEGVGAHAVSEIPVRVPAGAVRFSGLVGVDDAAGAPGAGSVRFRILAGDAVLWESPVMKCGDAPVAFDVATPSTRHGCLYLQADDVGENSHDHADWVALKWTLGAPEPVKPARVMSGAEFGLTPGDSADRTPALRRALAALREAPGSTLQLTKGEYHFRRDGALKRHFHISNHDQPVWQPVSVPLVDLRGVTLDGAGSTFVFHGEVLPVLIQDSEGVRLKGIGIDYARPPHSQGVIRRVESGAYELFVDPAKYPHTLRDGWFVHRGEGWEAPDWGGGILFDGKTHEIVAGTGDFGYRGKATDLGDGVYRIERDLTKRGAKPGDIITMRHSGRPHPAVVIYRAKDTVLEDAPIHAAQGMAVLGQRSENIRITGGGAHLRDGSGRVFTTNADADHFSNCRGSIVVENALFEGMMDDAINVHATCLRIEARPDARTLRCRYVHGQSVGFETFLPGETLRFIHAKPFEVGATRRVTCVRWLKTDEVLLTLDAPVPEGVGPGDAVENADWFPAVTFRNNTVRNNRARGSLFTTPKPVVVEGNRFINSSGSAILLAGDANGWYESGGCTDVLIRDNLFRNNLTSRYQFTEALISIYPEVPDLKNQRAYYHRNVRIENNTFETFDVPLLFAISTGGLSFAGNTVRYNADYPAWNRPPFILRRCEDVVIRHNRVENAPRGGAPWSAASVSRDALTPEGAVTVR